MSWNRHKLILLPLGILALTFSVMAEQEGLVLQGKNASSQSPNAEPTPTKPSNLSFQLKKIAKGLGGISEEYDRHLRYFNGVERGELILQPVKDGPFFRFRYVPCGEFVLGMTSKQRVDHITRYASGTKSQRVSTTLGFDSSPAVTGKILRGFFLLESELTQEQFNALVRQEIVSDQSSQLPVTGISWVEASEYCDQLSQQTGFAIRLPTEIEWEYASRGPSNGEFPWPAKYVLQKEGNFLLQKDFFAYINSQSPRIIACGPGLKDVSWRGHFEMAGNVSEWCLDIYKRTAYEKLPQPQHLYDPNSIGIEQSQPQGTGTGRVYRGGNYADSEVSCHLALRRDLDEEDSSPRIGFRPVLLLHTNVIEVPQAKGFPDDRQ